MIEYYIGLVAVVMLLIVFARRQGLIHSVAILFFVVQAAMVAYGSMVEYGAEQWRFFRFDGLGLLYCGIMTLMGLLSAWRSVNYYKDEGLRHKKIYFSSLILLSVSLIGVYLSQNIAVNWIFLEATTLATAGLTYHRRTVRALEATWKYIFVSSVGIAVAYLGILLLSTSGAATLSYGDLSVAVAEGVANPIYLKLAFLFILVGYSTKLEIFPLFTVGVDANHSSPAPASAFISSALVGGGFVSLYRVYGVMMESSVATWVMNLLMVVVVLSLVASAVYMGRTSNFKRFLAYSTVENSAIALLGLAVGGSVGIFASVLHSVAHSVIKGVSFLQMSIVGQMYGTYKIGRVSGYGKHSRLGGVTLVLCSISLVAVPPSLLFMSEFLLFREMLRGDSWWLFIVVLVPLLVCLYWSLTKLLWAVFSPMNREMPEPKKREGRALNVVLLVVMLGLFAVMVFGGDELRGFINLLIEEGSC